MIEFPNEEFMSDSQRNIRRRNLTYAGIAAQAGCWITLIVIGSLIAGLWLDAQFGLRGPFTIGLVILSVPVTLWLVFRIVLRLVAKIQPPPKKQLENDDASQVGGLNL